MSSAKSMSSFQRDLTEEDAEMVDSKTLVPSPPSNFILGPGMITEVLPTNFFPKHHMELYPYQNCIISSSSSSKLRYLSWPACSETWTKWVERVESSKANLWKEIGIYNAVQFSKVRIPFNEPLFRSAICFWSVSSNSFHFRFGPMTVTLLDMAVLVGLYPHGETITSMLDISVHEYNINLDRWGCAYPKFIESYMEDKEEVNDREHIAFLLYWLCKYLFCVPAHYVCPAYYKVAVALAQGRKLALGPLVLGALYRGLSDYISSKFRISSGPLWILQLWLHAYFKELRPNSFTSLCTPHMKFFGLDLVVFTENSITWEKCFSFFYTVTHRDGCLFLPFRSSPFACPTWVRFTRPGNPEETEQFDEIWASFLLCRDLHYGLSLSKSSKNRRGAEVYNPQLAARQFGMVQGVPAPPLHSVNYKSVERRVFTDSREDESIQLVYTKLKDGFLFPGIIPKPSTTSLFDKWWHSFMSNVQLRTPVELVLKKIKDRGLGKVDSDEVADESSEELYQPENVNKVTSESDMDVQSDEERTEWLLHLKLKTVVKENTKLREDNVKLREQLAEKDTALKLTNLELEKLRKSKRIVSELNENSDSEKEKEKRKKGV